MDSATTMSGLSDSAVKKASPPESRKPLSRSQPVQALFADVP